MAIGQGSSTDTKFTFFVFFSGVRHLDTARVEAEQGTSEKVDKIEKYEKG